MRYQVEFLLPLKQQKISCYFGLCWKMFFANQFGGLFTFDLFDLLILIPGVRSYIVLVLICILFVLYFFDKCRSKICIVTEKWTLPCDLEKCCLHCDNIDLCLTGCHYWFCRRSYQSEVFYKLAGFIKPKKSW